MAIALLCVYDPQRWPVMDKNALAGLSQLGMEAAGGTLAYFDEVRRLCFDLRDLRPAATVRDVDKGLFVIGREAQRAARRPQRLRTETRPSPPVAQGRT